MRFQTKILFSYMTIVVIVISAVTGIFYWYNARQFRNTAYVNMQETADRIAYQIDYQITFMDSTLENLMSDSDFMDAIRIRGGPEPQSLRESQLHTDANRIITSELYRYPLNKYIYRVNYFNRNFDFFSSRFNNRDTVNKGSEDIFEQMDWLSAVDDMRPKRFISALHDDQWLKNGENMVFSVIRNIRIFSVDAGYLEVQMESDKLLEMLNISEDEQLRIILVTPSGEILFHNLLDGQEPGTYLNFGRDTAGDVSTIAHSNTDEFVASTFCPYSNMQVFLIQDQETILAPQAAVGRLALIVSIGFLSLSFFYVYSWSVHLTKPIRSLRKKMKRIELSDLTDSEAWTEAPEDKSMGQDDIKALNRAFYQLFNRLSISIQNELKARALQMQANFNSLQAQINPHFLYNVLNVISNRGLIAGDEPICEICACIADMLRYSTSTQSKTATVAEEIAHVENYLTLLQMRYEHKLEYSVEVALELMQMEIPKIILQPFVENSLTHGYKKGNQNMVITIAGACMDQGWFLEVRDNGGGFDGQDLETLYNTLRTVDTRLETGEGDMPFSLGGMGIAGTYARLKIFLPSVCFSIGNNPDAGAFVRIEAKC